MPQSKLIDPVSNDTYLPKFFAVNGRIGRVRYIAYTVGASLLMLPLMFLMMGGIGILAAAGSPDAGAGAGVLGLIAFYALSFAVSFILARRRLHDLGKTGWLGLLMLIPVINLFVFLWFVFGPGDAQANAYGPAPAPNTTGVIVMAWALPVLVVAIGILAAVAIPAYSDYAAKANAAQLENGQ
jgi:uncharacterized membrane protein YhaH (DUF805 family)